MSERPYSLHTREKTWSALYAQHINACYALVPYSATNNSTWLIRCKTPEEAQATMSLLLVEAEKIKAFFASQPARKSDEKDDAWLLYNQWLTQRPACLKSSGEAVVLARSSDYWHYHLEDQPALALIVCGVHDSYLHLPVWEMSTNKRYAARETAIKIGTPEFKQGRGRGKVLVHRILLGALASGDQAALAFLKTLPPRTQRRLRAERDALLIDRYRGRPLAFHTDAERQAIGAKISAGLIRYYEHRRTG
ncbi:MAG TPA: hypothetical protein VF458_19335 [Ktedonobacteraceae bacterium]